MDELDGTKDVDNIECVCTDHRSADQLKEIILNLYTLMVQSYEYQGPATAGAMTNEVYAFNTLPIRT